MGPRSRVLDGLGGAPLDSVPLTVAAHRLRRSQTERQLRNEGLCLVAKGPPLLRTIYHKAEEERLFSGRQGSVVERIRIRTTVGELTRVVQHSPDRRASWTTERLFKSPKDYAPLVVMFRDQRFESNFGAFEAEQAEAGEDILLRPTLGLSPFHLVMHSLMGMETFAREWSDRRAEVLTLYKAVADNHRRRILQAAKSPARAVTYGGAVDPRDVGASRFAQYYLPHLREFADVMHTNGKLAGLQVQGDPRLLADAIGQSHADFVEGFQDQGFRLEEARRAWPDMTLWMEVPPTAHLLPEEGLRRWARDLLGRGHQGRVILSAGGLPPARRANLEVLHHALHESDEAALTAAGEMTG